MPAARPIHTRSLSVTLTHGTPERVDFAAYIIDLRKVGFAPVGGDLQGPGIIHHMRLDGSVDRAQRCIATIAAQMPTVAFEAAPATGGESCRDLIGRVDHLAGLPLDGAAARAVGAEIGGPRGCSHILTLAHLLVPTLAWALAEDERLQGLGVERRPGERVFRRDVTIDGSELAPGELELTAQLNDLHFAPAAALATPFERFARQREIAISGRVALYDALLRDLEARERVRDPAGLRSAVWADRRAQVAGLEGRSLRAGISGAVLAHFADPGDAAPLRDALLMLAPALIQCFAALDLWTMMSPGTATAAEIGGLPDSCYMWRRGSALIGRRGE